MKNHIFLFASEGVHYSREDIIRENDLRAFEIRTSSPEGGGNLIKERDY